MAGSGCQPRFGESRAPTKDAVGLNHVGYANLQGLTKAVVVVIGSDENQSSWLLHQKLFEESSQFARTHFQDGGGKDEDLNIVRLPNEEPGVFAEYVKFLYGGSILCFSLEILVRMYALGERLEAPIFIEACYQLVRKSESPVYSASTIKYVFDNTTSDDRLRKLLKKQLGRGILAGKYSWKADYDKKLLASVMVELMEAVTDTVSDQRLSSSRAQRLGKIPAQPKSLSTTLPSSSSQPKISKTGFDAGSAVLSGGAGKNDSNNSAGFCDEGNQKQPAFSESTASTSLFGQAPAGNALGSSGLQPGVFGTPSIKQPVSPPDGTLNPPFAPVLEKDTYGYTNSYQSLSVMPAYYPHSFEELRLADYNANRKNGNGDVGAPSEFAPGTFGAFGRINTAGGFGVGGGVAFTSNFSNGFGSSNIGGSGLNNRAGFGSSTGGGFGASSIPQSNINNSPFGWGCLSGGNAPQSLLSAPPYAQSASFPTGLCGSQSSGHPMPSSANPSGLPPSALPAYSAGAFNNPPSDTSVPMGLAACGQQLTHRGAQATEKNPFFRKPFFPQAPSQQCDFGSIAIHTHPDLGLPKNQPSVFQKPTTVNTSDNADTKPSDVTTSSTIPPAPLLPPTNSLEQHTLSTPSPTGAIPRSPFVDITNTKSTDEREEEEGAGEEEQGEEQDGEEEGFTEVELPTPGEI